MTGPEIRAAPGGATLRVRVSAGAKRDAITGLHGNALKLSVRRAPEKGRANREVLRLLAGAVGARTSQVEVARGGTARDKQVLFRGWSPAALRERVLAVLVTLGDP